MGPLACDGPAPPQLRIGRRWGAPLEGHPRRVARLPRVVLLATAGLALLLAAVGAGARSAAFAGAASHGRQGDRARSTRSLVSRRAVQPCRSEAFLDEAIANTASAAKNVLVVSFSTTWCGPCKLMDPKVNELSELFAEKSTFIKVPDGIRIMKREGVRTVPLYQIYKDGQKVDSVSGADAVALTQYIEKHTGMTKR